MDLKKKRGDTTSSSSSSSSSSDNRNAGPNNYMSRGSGGGGGGQDRKSIMMRGNGRPSSSSSNKDYRALLSAGDREETRAAGSGGGGGSGSGRSHKNISYRREGDEEERDSRRAFMDHKGGRGDRDRERSAGREQFRPSGLRTSWSSVGPPPSSRPNIRLEEAGDRSSSSSSSSYLNPQAAAGRRHTMGSEGAPRHRDESPPRMARSRNSEDDSSFGVSADADRMRRMKIDRRRTSEAEAEGGSSSGWEGGSKDRRRQPPSSWDAEPPPQAPPSGRLSLLQGFGRSSQPSRTPNAPAPSAVWARSGSMSGGGHQHQHQHQHQHPQHERKPHLQQQSQEVLLGPLLCRHLDAGGGTRPAPWSFNDVSVAALASSRSVLAFLPGGGSAGSATGSGMFSFGQSLDSAPSLHHRRSPTEEASTAGSSVPHAQKEGLRLGSSGAALSVFVSLEEGGEGMEEHRLARATSLQSPFSGGAAVGGEGVLSASGSASMQALEPRFQRSFSEATGSAPGGRLRLGWGQGLARRASTQEQPSPRVVPPSPSKGEEGLDGSGGSNRSTGKTSTAERAEKEGSAKPTAAAAGSGGAGAVLNGEGSPGKQGAVPLEQQQRRRERPGDVKGAEQRAGTRSRLRRMLLAFVRHVWHESAVRAAERASAAASASATSAITPTAAAGASHASTSGKKDETTGRERGSGEAGASGKVRRERPSEADEEAARTLKRQKSALTAQQEAVAAAKQAEKEAAQAKLQKYRSLSAAAGFPLCGLLPKESVGRALKATACVREKQPGTEAETTGAGAEGEAELVRLPSREDILAVLEGLNTEVERLQEEVATVEEEVSNATAASAAYRAPWWSKTYASVIRLRREAAEQLHRRRAQEEQQQQQHQQAARGGTHTLRLEVVEDASVSTADALGTEGGEVEESKGIREDEAPTLQRRTKRELVQGAVQAKKAEVRRYTEQLADQYLEISETWKRSQSRPGGDGGHAHFLSDSMRTTRTFAASQRSSYPGGGGSAGDRTSSRTGGMSSRGGDFAASEYDVALMAREIEEKEKMKLRMEQGGATVPAMLLLPERRGRFEFLDTSNALLTTDGEPMRCAGRGLGEKCASGCNCPLAVERQSRYVNPWSDMEKCIFLDKFLQYPKNFRKIASFLRRKSTHDVIEFYYDSKQCINYKALLKENEARRRGTDQELVWFKQAARQVGATVDLRYDGNDREMVRLFPPANDYLYTTFNKHPGSRPFHHVSSQRQQQQREEHGRGGRATAASPSSSSSYAFAAHSQAQASGGGATTTTTTISSAYSTAAATKSSFGFDVEITSMVSSSSSGGGHPRGASFFPAAARGGEGMAIPASSPRGGGQHRHLDEEDSEGKKVMTKWTEEEKQQAIQLLEVHGKQWALISEEMGGTKKPEQIKNFFSNYKKKYRLDERLPPPLPGQRRREPKRAKSPPPPPLATLTLPLAPMLPQHEGVPMRPAMLPQQIMAMYGAPAGAMVLPPLVMSTADHLAEAAIMAEQEERQLLVGEQQRLEQFQQQQQQQQDRPPQYQYHHHEQQAPQDPGYAQQSIQHIDHFDRAPQQQQDLSAPAPLEELRPEQAREPFVNVGHQQQPQLPSLPGQNDGRPTEELQHQPQQHEHHLHNHQEQQHEQQHEHEHQHQHQQQGLEEAVTVAVDVAVAQQTGDGETDGGGDKAE